MELKRGKRGRAKSQDQRYQIKGNKVARKKKKISVKNEQNLGFKNNGR